MTQWQGFWLYIYILLYTSWDAFWIFPFCVVCSQSRHLLHSMLFMYSTSELFLQKRLLSASSTRRIRRGTSKFRFASCPLLQCTTPKPCGFRAGEEASSTSSSKGTCCIVLLQLVFGDSVSDILVTCWPLLVSCPQADLCSAGPFDLPGLHR